MARNDERKSADITSIRPNHTRLSKYQDKMGDHLDRVNMQLDEEITELRRVLRENKNAIKTGNAKREVLQKEIKKAEAEAKVAAETAEQLKDEVQKAHDENAILMGRLHEHRQKGVEWEEKKNEARLRLEAAHAKMAELKKEMNSGHGLSSNHKPAPGRPKKSQEQQRSRIEQLRRQIEEAESELRTVQMTPQAESRSPHGREEPVKLEPPRSALSENVDSLKADTLKKLLSEKVAYLEELTTSLAESRDILRHERAEMESLDGKVERLTTANVELKQHYSALKKRKGKSRSSSMDSKSRPASDASLNIDAPRLRTSKMRSELVSIQRQQAALENRKLKLSREAETREKELGPLREEADRLNTHLRALEKEQEMLESAASMAEEHVNNSNSSILPKSEVEKKRDEMLESVKRLKTQLEAQKGTLETKKYLEAKVAPYKDMDFGKIEAERQEKQIELRRLKKKYQNLQKSTNEKQKELEQTVVQRDDTVDRANATLHSNTTIRNHRLQEIEALQKSIVDKEQQLAALQ